MNATIRPALQNNVSNFRYDDFLYGIDNPSLSDGLLAIGLVTGVVNVVIIVCAIVNSDCNPKQRFRLHGISTCNLFSGLVTALLPIFLTEPLSVYSCRLLHILVPTVCFASVYYLVAIFAYTHSSLLQEEQCSLGGEDKQDIQDILHIVFVLVSWFISLVFSSLPVVAVDEDFQYNGMCLPEVLFLGRFSSVLAYFLVIYLVPAISVNAIFAMSVLKLRRMLLAESRVGSVQHVEAAPSSSRITAASPHPRVDYSQRRSWENSVISRWTSIVQSRQPTKPSMTRPFFHSLSQRRDLSYNNIRAKHDGVPKSDSRLWKKLQDNVFSRNWRNQRMSETNKDTDTYEIRDNRASFSDMSHVHVVSRRTTTATTHELNAVPKRPDFTVIKQALVTNLIYLLVLNIAGVVRVLLVVEFLTDAKRTSAETLVLLSLTSESVASTVVGAVRFPHCRLCFRDLCQLARERFRS